MTFQTTVNANPAPGLEGDFCSANPRGSMLAGPGQLVAGSLVVTSQGVTAPGVIVGRFGWARNDNGQVSNANPGVAARLGFIHRNQLVLIAAYLAQSSLVVPAGREMTLFDSGDFWIRFAAGAAIGQKAFVSYADGTAIAAAAGATIAGASATASVGATFTGTQTGTSLVVTSVTGLISIGDTISGTGVTAGTTIVAQVSGTTGGAGTYTTSVTGTASTATITSFGTVLNATAVASGTLYPGQPVSGTNIPTGAIIASQISGTANGVGVYRLSVPTTQYVASEAVTTLGAIESKWYVDSVAGAGELAMCSSRG